MPGTFGNNLIGPINANVIIVPNAIGIAIVVVGYQELIHIVKNARIRTLTTALVGADDVIEGHPSRNAAPVRGAVYGVDTGQRIVGRPPEDFCCYLIWIDNIKIPLTTHQRYEGG